MFQFQVNHIGSFHLAQRWKAPCNFTGINLVVSGLKSMTLEGMCYTPAPFLSLAVEGMRMEFEFDEQRENWVIILEDAPLRLSGTPGLIRCSDGMQDALLPQVTPLSRSQVNPWQKRFQTLQKIQASPTPRNRLRVKIMVVEIIHYIINQAGRRAAASPAQELKQRIDEDTGFKLSIQELSAACGYSSDHLRRLFIRAYGIAPHTYRTQRRSAFATRYITTSDHSVKEIGAQLGFEFTSAFTTFYRKQVGMSPRRAIQKFRTGPKE